ncbi:ribbon-helix-helix domain-containing protein [Actinomadura sp. KC06]|uniref:ribbon-helix-helix domain-containing protein n=1 Tax=Actinomadura sp. KC06 TaxID=2530369 RepID=UPI001404C42F|nr:ribbon-helix-helix domain-containing protein [Actinomadura sp. KC06]
MATLSTKVPTQLADAFEQMAEESGRSTSAALRELVEMAVRCRRMEVLDPEVGPPVGWVFMQEPDD